MKSIFNSFFDTLFPPICLICKEDLFEEETNICLSCETSIGLHYPNEQLSVELNRRLYGKVKILHSFIISRYFKSSPIQKIVNEIKYKGHKNAAYWLGLNYGATIKRALTIDNGEYVLIPVPLHPSKYRKRGYNQSEWFAKGLGESLSIVVDTKSLVRTEKRSSQINKNRFQRWLNSEYLYQVKYTSAIKNKHIIIVDDVVTTGSTIESCALAFDHAEIKSISIIAIALAVNAAG